MGTVIGSQNVSLRWEDSAAFTPNLNYKLSSNLKHYVYLSRTFVLKCSFQCVYYKNCFQLQKAQHATPHHEIAIIREQLYYNKEHQEVVTSIH